MKFLCLACAAAKQNLEAAGAAVLKWACNHQPRIVLSTPFRIEDCTVVWEKVLA